MKTFSKTFLLGLRPYTWLAGLGFLLYSPSIWFDFVYLDDNVLILRDIHNLSNLGNIAQIFRQGVFNILHSGDTYYRPIPTLFLMLDAQISGTSPIMYHITNIVLHLVNVCLIFTLLNKIGFKKMPSFLTSLFFVVHPALVSAVAWIPGRNDSLLAIFIYLAFLNLINYLATDKIRQSAIYLVIHLVAFFLALLTKENALILPLVMITYFGLFDTDGQNFRQRFFNRKKNILYATWLVTIAIYFLTRQNALGNAVNFNLLPVIKNLIVSLPAVLIYLGKIIFPVGLSGYPVLKDSSWILGLISLAPIALLYKIGKKPNYKIATAGMIWFLFFLVPTFVRTDLNPDLPLLEQRAYLPMFGILLIILGSDFFTGTFKKINLKEGIILGIVGLYAINTFFYLPSYNNKIVFWENAKARSPSSPFVHNNLGAMYFIDGKITEAGAEFDIAIKINDSEPRVHNNAGLVLMRLGQLEKAKEEIKKELSLYPNYDDANYNLGLIYAQQKNYDDAVKSWEKTIEVNPDYLDAYAQLANYYSSEAKDETKAKFYYNKYTAQGGQAK